MAKSGKTRVYHVTVHGKDHLVEAGTKAAARDYVFQKFGSVIIASQKKIIDLMRAGITVEAAPQE